MVCYVLIFFFIVAAKGFRFARGVFDELVVLLEDVAAVCPLLDAEHVVQQLRHLNRSLTRDDVSHLVREDAREFVFGACEGDEFARDVDAPAWQREGVGDGLIEEEELKMNLCRRQLLDEPRADFAQMRRDFFIFDDA